MTNKQIDNITLAEAIKVLKENKQPVYVKLTTTHSEVKAKARQILRNAKKQNIHL